MVFLVIAGFVFGRADGMQVRWACGQRVVSDMDAHHVIRHRRHRRRMRGGSRRRQRSRWRPLYTQPTNTRTKNIKIGLLLTNLFYY